MVKISWRRAWQPTPIFFPRKSHGQRNLEGYIPWGQKESDMTEATEHTEINKKRSIFIEQKDIIVEVATIPKLIFSFNTTPIEITTAWFFPQNFIM